MEITVVVLIMIFIVALIMIPFNKKQDSNLSNVSRTLQSISNVINVTVSTDGQSTTVNAVSISGSKDIFEDMAKKMRDKVNSDILSDKSTVKSLKSDLKIIAQEYNYTARVTLTSQFGIDKLPFVAIVSGNSMFPTLMDGQVVIALKTTSFKVGDIVIARHPHYGLIIKRLAALSYENAFLKSDNRIVEVVNNEKILPDGTVEIETIETTPLDTWISKNNLITVVKIY
jgi:SOS-response transcriptional repressor LexA